MKPIRDVEVVSVLPTALECIRELAYNLRWTWDHETRQLFCRLDRQLWESSGHNPVVLLNTVSQERLNAAASDSTFLANLEGVCKQHYEYMRAENTWYSQHHGKPGHLIAYFSAEFGLTESLPIYSGGLGILAGDHVKAASELGLPLVAVGIVYQEGYFKQYLNQDGWQQERYPINDFYNLPIVLVKEKDGSPVFISVDFPGRKVYAQIWKAQVGRVPIYLLDTNIAKNNKNDEAITDALYHGDSEFRMQQEIILGVGGMRALAALGITPSVCHMNEGHSAFLGVERTRMLMKTQKLSFKEAQAIASAGQVFTTHTAVPAGIDKFSKELMARYWSDYARELGISLDEFLSLGACQPTNGEPFSMAVLAINLSAKVNAVSALHGQVSRQLFQSAWKDIPEHEVPITHITNGVHVRSWISDDLCHLYDRYLGPKWVEDMPNPDIWSKVAEIPDEEIWRVRERRRQQLVYFCRKRLLAQLEQRGALPSELKGAADVLDPGILTIGFARRMATYKRATLLLRDKERLTAILSNKDRPVQIIIAGKAHPEDMPAKDLIKEIVQFCRNEKVRHRLVFLENYDINVARWMVGGVDVWLNTPRRFLEASGTSGMKVVFNAGINLSVLDGWWDEAYDPAVGWAIGYGEVYADCDYQDELESAALYDLLENEIMPSFYDRDAGGLPRAWLTYIKASMSKLGPVFNVNRMVREYAINMYLPASGRYLEFIQDGGERARQLAAWKSRLKAEWKNVQINAVEGGDTTVVRVGDQMTVSAWVQLAGLSVSDLSVQIYYGKIDTAGDIAKGLIEPMVTSGETKGAATLFTGTICYRQGGRHGFTVRVLPNHRDLNSPFETGLILWASDPISVTA